MMTRFFTTLVLLVGMIAISACSLEERLANREEKIVGPWRIDKAWYKADRALFRRNVEDEFGDDIIEFFDNYSAVYDDLDSGLLFWGDWSLDAYRESDDDGVDFILNMDFFDERDRVVYSFLSHVTLLTREKMNLTIHEPAGVYTFRLRRYD